MWLTYAGVCCNAWVASALFHSRDTRDTERYDYLSAFAVVVASCAAAAIRIAGATRCAREANCGSRNHSKSFLRLKVLTCVAIRTAFRLRGCLLPARPWQEHLLTLPASAQLKWPAGHSGRSASAAVGFWSCDSRPKRADAAVEYKKKILCLWRRAASQLALATLAASVWATHAWRMLRVRFDYGWNMQLCLALGALQSFAWLTWALTRPHPGRCGLTCLAMSTQVGHTSARAAALLVRNGRNRLRAAITCGFLLSKLSL